MKLTILSYLVKNAKGLENVKTASEIQASIGVHPAKLREVVNTLRCEGYPIASGQRGYFYARSYRELRDTLDHMQGRVASINEAIVGLERAFLYNHRNERHEAMSASFRLLYGQGVSTNV